MTNSGILNSLIISFITVVSFSCINSKSSTEQFGIYPLYPYEDTVTVDKVVQKYKYYIVSGFQFGNKQHLEQIKNFIKANKDADYSKFSQYTIVFYKESLSLKRNFQQKESDLLLWHGEDIIFSFGWDKGQFSYYITHKNGVPVNTNYNL